MVFTIKCGGKNSEKVKQFRKKKNLLLADKMNTRKLKIFVSFSFQTKTSFYKI